jgi:hypothetical protein
MNIQYQNRVLSIEKEARISYYSSLTNKIDSEYWFFADQNSREEDAHIAQMDLLRLPTSQLIYLGEIDRRIVKALLGHYDSWYVKSLIEKRQFSTGKDVNARLTVSGLTPLFSLAYTTNTNNNSRLLKTVLELGGQPKHSFFRTIVSRCMCFQCYLL